MDGPFEVRAARLEDAAELAALAGTLGYATATDDMRARLHRLNGRSDHHVVVIANEKGILGWTHVALQFLLESGECAEIVGLVVGERARRLGVGAKLVRAAEQWARERNQTLLIVRSNVIRIESHRFYPAQGFAQTKTQHVYSKTL